MPVSEVDDIYMRNPPTPPRPPMAAAAAAAGAPPGEAGRRWNNNTHYPYYDSDDAIIGYWVHVSQLNAGQRQRLDLRHNWHQIPLEGYQNIFGKGSYGKSGKQKEDAGYEPYKGSGKGAHPPSGTASWDWPSSPAPPPEDPAKGSAKGKASSSKGSGRYESDEDYYRRGSEILNQWAQADRGWQPPQGRGKSTGKSKSQNTNYSKGKGSGGGSSSWQQYRGYGKGGW